MRHQKRLRTTGAPSTCQNLSAPSPGDDLRSKSAIRLRGQIVRSDCFWGNRLRFLCGNDTVAVAMHFTMKNSQICFSLRKFLAISLAIQKIVAIAVAMPWCT